ncbi:MAG TPA: hypothetical protein VLG10_02350 [Methylomirabilota bacterium]|nr:hypothetical protein [Methylomirabilota bacterium]
MFPAPAIADRAHDLAAQAPQAQRATCQGVTSLSTCHPQFPTGCSHSANPAYDAYLNFLMNQVPPAAAPISRYVTRKRILETLEPQTPAGLTSRNHAIHAPALAGLDEGNIVAVVGHLYFVQDTGAETTNCQLDGPGETDFHIGVGFNRAIARGLLDGHTPTAVERRRLQQTSIVVEMTPHFRAGVRPEWTLVRLRRAEHRPPARRAAGADLGTGRPESGCHPPRGDQERPAS